MIKPSRAQRFDVRCNVGDVVVANLAMHIVFFFERHLDPDALAGALVRALDSFPVFAGRMAGGRTAMTIRCDGQGVPFTAESSSRTLDEAIRSTLQDNGSWLVDRVNGPLARWGWGPLCQIRVTHLADEASAIGVSWHHAVGDMHTLMHFMDAWAAAAAGKPPAEPLIVEDRAAYLDEHLPADGAREPGVRCLSPTEIASGAWYLVKGARGQRTLNLYFGEDEIARMRSAYGDRIRLSANDAVCAHVTEALMWADPAVDSRALAIVVNVRNRCGLDPMLIGNIVTTLKVDVRRGEPARAIAERIRHHVDHFADEHCDMRINQRFLDAIGAVRAVRCVTNAFNPMRWNPLVTNLSGFGVYRLRFEDTATAYCVLLMTLPIAGAGALLEGAGGTGLVFQMALPAKEFEAMSKPTVSAHLHRFRRADDDIPRLHRAVHG